MREGGTLVRFAGPRLAEHPDSLLPVRLRAGERQLGGSLSWEQPQHMAPFPDSSPSPGWCRRPRSPFPPRSWPSQTRACRNAAGPASPMARRW
ncbi:hypothetical protein ACFQU7_02440 [Pseudoroseomonas wenyumeiae]